MYSQTSFIINKRLVKADNYYEDLFVNIIMYIIPKFNLELI